MTLHMKPLTTPLMRFATLALCTLQLAACSKTVHWEEEVPLNTGETIWVKRTVEYSLKGAGGNPFDISYRQDKTETLTFQWGGKNYVYKGDAELILLAISPRRQPVLVAPAADKGWDWNNDYYCASPHYVQFVPDETGRNWTWPPAIEPWLYDLPQNLMRQRGEANAMKARYTAQQREAEDAIGSMQGPYGAKIDPNHTSKTCKRKG
jgi:hypothetical protein